jgi:hypothetical protein
VRWASVLLPLGNAYLRSQGVAAEMLSLRGWLQWEQDVARFLGRTARISVDGSGLEFPFTAGDSLSNVLRDDLPLQDKLSALQMAAGALRQLHARSVQQSDAEPWPLSHGDATCHNVIVNLSTAAVEWIDFDMRHWRSVPADERRADDLRALLFSAAACLSPADYAKCVEQVLTGYGGPRTVSALRQSLDRQRCPTVFQLAQAPMSYADYFQLRRLLLEPDVLPVTG